MPLPREATHNRKRATESLTAALPEALIRAQIAAGLTQKDLGARLSPKEQPVKRYESTRNSGASLERAQAVMEALGVGIREHLALSTPEKSS